jgi:hypothetical protein
MKFRRSPQTLLVLTEFLQDPQDWKYVLVPPRPTTSSKVPVPECVGEKVVKFGVRNGEIRVRGNAGLGNRGAPSRCLRTGKDLSFCELLAEKCS